MLFLTYMKLTTRLIFAISALILPNLCHADPIYYLITGQANANTTIDAGHEMQWSAPSLTPGCFVANCSTYPITQFDSTFDWLLGGGSFVLKAGNSPTDDIMLRLWEGNVGGTLASPTGTLLRSAVVLSSSVSGSYTATDFVFPTAVTIQTGHHYILTLTSGTGEPGNEQYFVKGIDVLAMQDSLSGTGQVLTDPTAPAPEPATWTMMAAGGVLVLVSRLKRSRREA
jgi:hypothetical protein